MLQNPYDTDWHRVLVSLVHDCIREQGNGFDALASAAWDRIVDHFAPVADSQLADKEWIRDRWGGFTYLVIGRNEDFMLDFKDGSLWLHYENDIKDSPVGRMLLLEMPTRQRIIDAERMFGCI